MSCNTQTSNPLSSSLNEKFQYPPKQVAILGTMSDAGKSILTAGICRVLRNGGYNVAPFKAQNMSNNAAPALLSESKFIAEVQKNVKHGKAESNSEILGCRNDNDDTNEDDDKDDDKDDFRNEVDDADDGDDGDNTYYGEIGTAQVLQAEACRIVPRVEMNPVLLKSGGRRSSDGAYLCSIFVLGKQIAIEDYGSLGKRSETLLESVVIPSIHHLQKKTNADIIVMEGAGSCTEMNLMKRDIVNLPLVRKLKCPWLLVANIDPGGVFAQIVGTKACVSASDWDLCVGVIVNKLRGDEKYFEPGPSMLKAMVGKPIFVVPYLYNLNLPEEDGLGVERRLANEHRYDMNKKDKIKQKSNKNLPNKPIIVVVAYPHVAISDDLAPLEADHRFQVEWRRDVIPAIYPQTTCVILPGSRLSLQDLNWLMVETNWGEFIKDHVRAGGHVLGLCGGYQMLGLSLDDSKGIEGLFGKRDALGILPVQSKIEPVACKVVKPQSAFLLQYIKDDEGKILVSDERVQVKGFELHCGRTHLVQDTENEKKQVLPLLSYNDDKCEVENFDCGICVGNVKGTYLHGILKTAAARRILLQGLFCEDGVKRDDEYELDNSTDPLDRLANHLQSCGLDTNTLINLI